MDKTFDKKHVESVLKRAGVSTEDRAAILDGIHFPVGIDELQAVLLPLGITRSALINRMGGSP